MVPLPCSVRRIQRETHDTFSVELSPGHEFPFVAGQFNMLYWFGVGEVAISISGDPTKPGRLTHTIRSVGSVTQGLQKLKPGDVLGVRGPFGKGWPVETAAGGDLMFVAGGVGLAPLRPAIYYVLANRKRYGRVVLLYGARTPADILYKQELERWRARFDLQVHVTVDHGTGGWQGRVGVVTSLISKPDFDPGSTTVMICGPEVMMRFTEAELEKRELPPQNIYISVERNMKCALGLCGHCQFGPTFICKDGPVFPYESLRRFLAIREV